MEYLLLAGADIEATDAVSFVSIGRSMICANDKLLDTFCFYHL